MNWKSIRKEWLGIKPNISQRVLIIKHFYLRQTIELLLTEYSYYMYNSFVKKYHANEKEKNCQLSLIKINGTDKKSAARRVFTE